MIAEPRQTSASLPAWRAALGEAIAVARLAPSSHNCQPWAVASFESSDALHAITAWLGAPHDDERWLVLAIDTKRALTALPSLSTEMRLSCGMFLQLLVAALGEQGLAARVVPCGGRPAIAGYPDAWTPVAAVAVAPGVPQIAAWSTRLAADRRTNRAPYQDCKVSPSDTHALATATALFGDRGDASIRLITDPGAVHEVGRFVGRHAGVDFADLRAWSETFQYIRFGNEKTTDGFAITQLFGPLPATLRQFLRLALSPPVMRALRHLGVPRVMAHELGKLVGRAPLLVCVSVTGTSTRAELTAGGLAMDLWMRATAAGLALHPVSALLQHTELRERFQRWVVPQGRAVFFARVGSPTTTFPPTARRSLEPGDPSSGWVRL
ncbi:MAG: hypothetical protein ABI678_01770 [Kofleriaceae bacterium]